MFGAAWFGPVVFFRDCVVRRFFFCSGLRGWGSGNPSRTPPPKPRCRTVGNLSAWFGVRKEFPESPGCPLSPLQGERGPPRGQVSDLESCLVSSPNQTCEQAESQEPLAEDADWRARALFFLGGAESEDKDAKQKRKELKRVSSGDWIMAVDRSLQASVGKGLPFWSSLPPLDGCKPVHRRRAGPLEAAPVSPFLGTGVRAFRPRDSA